MFTSLPLKRDLIEPTLRSLATQGKVFDMIVHGATHTNFRFFNGEQEVVIAAYFNKDGLTTLTPLGKPGAGKELATTCCAEVKKQCSYVDGIKTTNESFKGITQESVDYLALSLTDRGHKVDMTPEAAATLYKITSSQGDQFTLKHHKTGTLQIQGKTLLAALDVINIMAKEMGLNKVIEWKNRLFNIKLEPAEVQHEIDALLPNAKSYLSGDLESVLAPSFVFRRMELNLSDYSSYVFPALRGLEGYIKKLMAGKGIKVGSSRDGLSSYFSPADKMVEAYKKVVGCPKTCRALEMAHGHYAKQRHGLFHMDSTDGTSRVITERDEANNLILETMNIIEQSYTVIKT